MCDPLAWLPLWPVALVALAQLGIAVRGGQRDSVTVTPRDAVTLSRCHAERDGVDDRRSRKRLLAAARQRRCRARKAVALVASGGSRGQTKRAGGPSHSPGGVTSVTPRDSVTTQTSLSFFKDTKELFKKERETRASAPRRDRERDCERDAEHDGFAALVALWPKPEAIEDARRAYRHIAKTEAISAGELIAAAQRYLAAKPLWQECLQLHRWLRTQRWKDPILPLASSPRAVTSAEAQAPEHGLAKCESADWGMWRPRLRGWSETAFWPSMWGPKPDQPGCEVPPALLAEIRAEHREAG